jgi:hypothetical protein
MDWILLTAGSGSRAESCDRVAAVGWCNSGLLTSACFRPGTVRD